MINFNVNWITIYFFFSQVLRGTQLDSLDDDSEVVFVSAHQIFDVFKYFFFLLFIILSLCFGLENS